MGGSTVDLKALTVGLVLYTFFFLNSQTSLGPVLIAVNSFDQVQSKSSFQHSQKLQEVVQRVTRKLATSGSPQVIVLRYACFPPQLRFFLNEISKASLLEILPKNTLAVYTLKVRPAQKAKCGFKSDTAHSDMSSFTFIVPFLSFCCWAFTNFCFWEKSFWEKSFWESFWDHWIRQKKVQVGGSRWGAHMSVV